MRPNRIGFPVNDIALESPATGKSVQFLRFRDCFRYFKLPVSYTC